MQLAYRQLDWAIIWWVDDYVPLNDAQESRLRTQVVDHLNWHCSTELPRYNEWLATISSQSKALPVQPQQVVRLQDQLFDAIDRLLVEITPTTVQLLRSTSDAQVASLSEAMAEGQQEREEDFLAETREEQINDREERTRERAETWLGDLTDQQSALIAQWSQARGAQTAIWVESRERWQNALREVMRDRDSPDFEQQITRLLQNSMEVRGPEYEAMLTESLGAMATLITELINLSTPGQRQHLDNEISELREDFAALVCDRAV